MNSSHLAFLLSIFATTQALDNGLALTPPMGWMHWQRFRCLIDCDIYPDECVRCEPSINVISDPIRFPSGLKNLSDYVHGKGLKFGIYGDYGTLTCGGYPGSKDYLEIDANTFAEWGVDYLKLDGCYSDYHTIEGGYIKMGKYLNATGRPIVYSCSWPAYQEPEGLKSNYSLLSEVCNLWRNWDDIEDSWYNVTEILQWFADNQDRISQFSGPGHWNDPDMLIIGNYGLSFEQSKAQMAIWAVMAAPLIMSVDLRTIDQKAKDILLNKDVIAVNQDPLGIMGRLVLTKERIDIWTKPVLPKIDDSYSYAIGFLSHRVDGYPRRINFTLSELGINSSKQYTLKDLFEPENEQKIVTTKKLVFIRVKPTGGVLLLATPEDNSIKNQKR
nr:alpha-N-acetylgalactosaminidase-like [Leptinotarsa decemlineata]